MVRTASARANETHAAFLGTAHPEINIDRARRRVLEGGHDVPEFVRRRTRAFASSYANCPRQGQSAKRRRAPVNLWPRNSSVALRSSTNSAARLSCSCSM